MASVITIAVHVASHVGAGLSSIRHSIAGLLSSIGSSLGSVGQSITQSIGSAMSQGMSNPYVAAGVAALVAAVAPAIGALLAAGITLAFGGAFIGLGAFLLKDNEKVKAAWGNTIGDLKRKFTDAAKPLIPVLTHAATLVGQLGDKFAPHFKAAMDAAAPHLTSFLDRLAKGIEIFGKKAFKPMMQAFNDLLDSIDLTSFFGALGDAFAYLGKVVSQNKREIGLLISVILGILPVAIRVIGFLASLWGMQVRHIQAVIRVVQQVISWIGRIKGKTVPIAQRGAATVVRSVQNVIGTIRRFVSKTVTIAQRGAAGARSAVQGVINTIRRYAGKTVSIAQRGAGAARSAVQGVINTIRRYIGKTVSVGVRGVAGAVSAIRRLIGWISRIKGKVVNIGANIVGAGKSLLGKLFAKGGIIGAAVGGPRGNTVMVGEQGPEMVRLPFGSTVRTNSDTRRLASGGGGSMAPFTVVLNVGEKRFAEVMIDPLKKVVRARGGLEATFGS